jgi:hypothetical protein
MIIKTNYKDYYDHIAHIYGGGDPKIVYVRPHRLKNLPSMSSFYNNINRWDEKYDCESIQHLYDLHRRWNGWKNEITGIKGIVIGDIFFAQIKREKENKYRLVTEEDMGKKQFWHKLELKDYINKHDPSLVTVCRTLDLPVFSFNVTYGGLEVDEYIPKLGEIGIASYINPNDMYQHLSYFVGNTMKVSPDMMPPVEVDNKIRILNAGFDLKTSFRGKV